jgi:hypothetical protein
LRDAHAALVRLLPPGHDWLAEAGRALAQLEPATAPSPPPSSNEPALPPQPGR